MISRDSLLLFPVIYYRKAAGANRRDAGKRIFTIRYCKNRGKKVYYPEKFFAEIQIHIERGFS